MYEGDERSQLNLRLFRVWSKAAGAVFDNIKKDIESYGISMENFMILELLYSKGPHTIQRISEILSIPSGSITYVVDKLEKKDYVRREPSKADRRASNVVLTDTGTGLFNEIFPQHVDTIGANLSFIGDEEKEQLIGMLKRIGLGAQELQPKRD
ncbi:MarR family transcriptional regulator [Paenibacillus sp. N4]|uniref:MarR family winged helix-turn-helix transcriptional regulator n=1 Tax=Paenibacillus vietnamensis TaxID=2590547 RepID=UPI001CD0EE01|nr:MarR family transcriptional regulator [Paenibacillus vietnamensis]MCA0756407.1 MarR family transcriptional regulator [Paenibacillus vietnamensis]